MLKIMSVIRTFIPHKRRLHDGHYPMCGTIIGS